MKWIIFCLVYELHRVTYWNISMPDKYKKDAEVLFLLSTRVTRPNTLPDIYVTQWSGSWDPSRFLVLLEVTKKNPEGPGNQTA